MNSDIPTIMDVARLANVSKATVSRVLNNSELVRPETKQLVKDAMEKLDFKPNVIARGMRKGVSKTIGVIIPDFTNIFYSYMFKEIESALSKYGYMAIICPVTGDEKKEREYCERLLSRNIDGIIFFDYNSSEESSSFLTDLSRRIPLVLMDEPRIKLDISQVYTDGFDALYRSTEFMIAHGHTKIACLASDVAVTFNQLKGYLAALEDHNIPAREEYIFPIEFNVPSGAAAAQKLMALPKRPTAVVSVGDYPSIGMVNMLLWSGVRVPEDLELISFDDIDLASSMKPNLSTVAQPVEKLAKEAVRILIDKIGNPDKWNEVVKSVFKGKLILRDTTRG